MAPRSAGEGALVAALLTLLAVAIVYPLLHLYMQSAVGRRPGAALGVVAILLVAAGTWAATALARRPGAARFRS